MSDTMQHREGPKPANESSERTTSRDLRNLSFSQAHGYEELPQPLKLEELPKEARVHIWNVFYSHMRTCRSVDLMMARPDQIEREWEAILRQVHLWHCDRPLDEWDRRFHVVRDDLKSRILQLPFNEVFDLIQFVMRQSGCPHEFSEKMKEAFAYCRLAYTITEDKPPTVIPAVTKTEGETIVTALSELNTAGLAGSATHLRKSAECINRSAWADSIRESIHAVESVARRISPHKSHTLTQALKSINQDDSLHPGLIEACKRLYGYTSDEQGVRHALLDRKVSRVGRDEAVFMLGACASFASYLWRKHAEGEES